MSNKIILRIVLLIVFILGLTFYLKSSTTNSNPIIKESLKSMSLQCPNLLREEGDVIMLYDLTQPGSNINPAVFYNLAEYSQFVEEQQEQGINCPILKLQTDTVGSSISNNYSIMENDYKNEILNKGYRFNYNDDVNNNDVDVDVDIEVEHFDKYANKNAEYSQNENTMDTNEISDNPMDTNWGGVQYSAQSLASGKYDGNMVEKPLYHNVRQNGTYFDPNVVNYQSYGKAGYVPPNYVPQDLLGKGPRDIAVYPSY